ncbi:hypothetical protein HOF56_03125 [Candidatus Peribacteria bacterium]|jgi:hypothetical protein|nr:hypothetical protein [Candidatus Peribacteria bacterium]MBT4021025.1 hypothetical protein [Candidatus Peribacteria bacterium]MBT4240923.1 hypothetical protein [Candidatus Peribacteria bacterium]MBT4474566.1 hypothetical protein [Candidatus Peribacteria bacterium]
MEKHTYTSEIDYNEKERFLVFMGGEGGDQEQPMPENPDDFEDPSKADMPPAIEDASEAKTVAKEEAKNTAKKANPLEDAIKNTDKWFKNIGSKIDNDSNQIPMDEDLDSAVVGEHPDKPNTKQSSDSLSLEEINQKIADLEQKDPSKYEGDIGSEMEALIGKRNQIVDVEEGSGNVMGDLAEDAAKPTESAKGEGEGAAPNDSAESPEEGKEQLSKLAKQIQAEGKIVLAKAVALREEGKNTESQTEVSDFWSKNGASLDKISDKERNIIDTEFRNNAEQAGHPIEPKPSTRFLEDPETNFDKSYQDINEVMEDFDKMNGKDQIKALAEAFAMILKMFKEFGKGTLFDKIEKDEDTSETPEETEVNEVAKTDSPEETEIKSEIAAKNPETTEQTRDAINEIDGDTTEKIKSNEKDIVDLESSREKYEESNKDLYIQEGELKGQIGDLSSDEGMETKVKMLEIELKTIQDRIVSNKEAAQKLDDLVKEKTLENEKLEKKSEITKKLGSDFEVLTGRLKPVLQKIANAIGVNIEDIHFGLEDQFVIIINNAKDVEFDTGTRDTEKNTLTIALKDVESILEEKLPEATTGEDTAAVDNNANKEPAEPKSESETTIEDSDTDKPSESTE